MRCIRTILIGAIIALPLSIPAIASGQSPELTLTASPDAITHFREGWTAAEALQTESAAMHFKLALDRDPGFGLARAMWVASGGASAATQTAELNRAVTDASKGSPAELALAMAFREQVGNRPGPAAALFQAASVMVPADPYLSITALTVRLGPTPAEQFAAVKQWVAKFPDYGPGYNSLAYSAWAAGDHAAALDAAMKQVQLIPKSPNAHDSYAEMLQWSGKLSEAATHYQGALELDSTFTEALIGLAEVEALQGHYDKARIYVEQAIARTHLPAQKLTYMRDVAGIYALARDNKSLARQLDLIAKEATAQGNSRVAAIAYSQLAANSAAQGNDKAAHAYIAMANAAMPAMPAFGYFFAAMAHGQLKHWGPAAAAITAAKSAREYAATKDRIAAAEAFLATSQGKPADGIALLSSADLTDLLVAGRLAEAYAAAGRTADAMKLQQQIANDYALNLIDFPAANARARARVYLASTKKK
jgi:Tfp pilus assembly protein PilF